MLGAPGENRPREAMEPAGPDVSRRRLSPLLQHGVKQNPNGLTHEPLFLASRRQTPSIISGDAGGVLR